MHDNQSRYKEWASKRYSYFETTLKDKKNIHLISDYILQVSRLIWVAQRCVSKQELLECSKNVIKMKFWNCLRMGGQTKKISVWLFLKEKVIIF